MIYLDNASTTALNIFSLKWLKNADNYFGNPSNIYSIGLKTRTLVEEARIKVANAIGADAEDIYFTSGASESNAWAIKQAYTTICSPYEHHSIIANDKVAINKKYISDTGEQFTTLSFKEKLSDEGLDTANHLYSHMLVNNETGEIFNVKKDFNEVHTHKLFYTHTDATQAIGNIDVNVKQLDADMLSLSGHKFHAPKGIGVLYINHEKIPREKVIPLIYGTQENNCRGGTENFFGIVCLGDCIEEAVKNIERKNMYCKVLNSIVKNKLYNSGVDFRINSPDNSIFSTINFSLKDIEGEVIASMLSDKKIYIGTGSACNNDKMEPSYVLKAMNVSDEYIRGAIRLSFDLSTAMDEVKFAMDEIIKAYKELK